MHDTMSIQNATKRQICPTHPGEMLREDFLPDYGLTTATLSDALGVSGQTINEFLKERRSVTPLMALRLSRLFGNAPEFWRHAQQARDLWEIERRFQKELDEIRSLDGV